ncbi:MAG: iron-containing alcohol dehydrogenase [Dialister sp.]|uniref:iron-containing alcohol dehydrogenase n=1 Tax=Dialister sp. TaxID=1955814 RepID=UPI002E760584|nr:iron-containing alcohol dehydrogenase [Dialister sp.]MEE0292118.1 iron-containing alcohol dehydrogenase [Dialister sp.]
MVDPFIYCNPTKVYFGHDAMSHIHEELPRWGKNVLLVYGGGSIKESGIYDKVVDEIRKAGVSAYEISGVKPNPELPLAVKGARFCREAGIDLILAVGGGSVIDTAKVIAGSALYEEDPWDLVKSRAQISRALPLLAIPTMAATGSEMNSCAVITNPDTHEKLGWTTEALRPKVSFLDPKNTFTVPPAQTAFGSADILSHILEVYLNRAEGFDAMDGFMESMMRSVIRWAPLAMADGANEEARANLLWDSEWAINDLIDRGHSVSWSCHALEHELSAFYPVPHGLGLAILTPAFMEYVLNEDTAPRLAHFAVRVMGVKEGKNEMKTARKGIKKLRKFFRKALSLPGSLSEIGMDDALFEDMAAHAMAWKSTDGILHGFYPLTEEDFVAIYKKAL